MAHRLVTRTVAVNEWPNEPGEAYEAARERAKRLKSAGIDYRKTDAPGWITIVYVRPVTNEQVVLTYADLKP